MKGSKLEKVVGDADQGDRSWFIAEQESAKMIVTGLDLHARTSAASARTTMRVRELRVLTLVADLELAARRAMEDILT